MSPEPKYHGAHSLSEIEKCDFRIFVYRDPAERAASLFINKIIMDTGNRDILQNIAYLTSSDPWDLCFDKFVKCYLSKPAQEMDGHTWSQYSHLKPIHYTHAIYLHHLKDKMSIIIGKNKANTFFGQKINSSGRESEKNFNKASTITARELNRIWLRDGVRPTTHQLISKELRDTLNFIYSDDVDMIKKIKSYAAEYLNYGYF